MASRLKRASACASASVDMETDKVVIFSSRWSRLPVPGIGMTYSPRTFPKGRLPDLAGFDRARQGDDGLLDRHLRVRTTQIIEIGMVGVQPPERIF